MGQVSVSGPARQRDPSRSCTVRPGTLVKCSASPRGKLRLHMPLDQFRRRALDEEAALVQHAHAVGEALEIGELMR